MGNELGCYMFTRSNQNLLSISPFTPKIRIVKRVAAFWSTVESPIFVSYKIMNNHYPFVRRTTLGPFISFTSSSQVFPSSMIPNTSKRERRIEREKLENNRRSKQLSQKRDPPLKVYHIPLPDRPLPLAFLTLFRHLRLRVQPLQPLRTSEEMQGPRYPCRRK